MKKLALFVLSLTFLAAACTKKDDGLTQTTELQTLFIGNVIVSGNLNLDYLKSIQSISGNLTITDIANPHGQGTPQPINNLDALKNLKRIGGDLILRDLNQLKNLIGLNNLEQIDGSILIGRNCSVVSFKGLDALKKIKSISTAAMSTSNFKGELSFLDVNKDVSCESINISSTNGLTELKGLDVFKDVKTCNFLYNLDLKSIQNLPRMGSAVQFIIQNNLKLETIEGSLTGDQFHLVHVGDTRLKDLTFLSNMTAISSFVLNNNSQLTTLNLDKIQELGSINISNCISLQSLKGLENCKKNHAFISNNDLLENIDAISNMGGGYLTIYRNPNLKSIDSLNDLGKNGKYLISLSISGNKKLTELCPVSLVIKNMLKARETLKHIQMPSITDNGGSMTMQEIVDKCK